MVDLYPRFEVIQLDNELANVSLIWNSLLGCTPTSPELTITLQCLELYHQLQCCQSSFGIQAYTKVLCVLHGVSGFKSYVVTTDLYLRLHIILIFVISFPWNLMCILQFYMPSNAASTKCFSEMILAGTYGIIVLHVCSRYVFNLPTILSNSFTSNLVNLSLFAQVSRQWMATTLPSGWIMWVMLITTYFPVYTWFQGWCAHMTRSAWQCQALWWWLCGHMAGC